MNEKSVGILYALRQLYAADGTTLPRKAVAGLIDDVLTAEAGSTRGQLVGGRPAASLASGPARPDWRENIRAYGRDVIAKGAGLIPAIRLIREEFGLSQKDFAELIGTSETTLSMAMTGKKERETLICKMTEFFGE